MAMLRVNLVPPRIRAARIRRMMIVAAAGATAVFLTIPAGFAYLRLAKMASLKAQVRRVEAEAAKPEYAGVIEKVTQLEAQEAAVSKKLEVLDKLLSRQATWIKVLEALSFAQGRARDLWLTSISSKTLTAAPDTGKTELTISGRAFSVASVDEFVRSFIKSDFAPEGGGQQTITMGQEAGQSVVSFTVSFKFKV